MTTAGQFDSLPEAPQIPERERAKEAFRSQTCPACGAVKKAGHWFDLGCWNRLPLPLQNKLDLARRGKLPGWFPFWKQAAAILEERA